MPIVFEEREHPRDRLGRFRRKLKLDVEAGGPYSELADADGRAAWDDWASTLSTDIDFDAKDFGERGSLENYTGTATHSAAVNELLRKGTLNEAISDPQEVRQTARNMTEAIGRTSVPENTVAYRFFEDDELMSLAREGNIVGTRIYDGGFMSTSMGTDVMREAGFTGEPMSVEEESDLQAEDVVNPSGSIIATIRVPAGAKGAYLNASGISDEEAQAGFFRKGGLSPYPSEQELLLGDGTTAEITSARFDPETGALLIRMDVVEQLDAPPARSAEDEREPEPAEEEE